MGDRSIVSRARAGIGIALVALLLAAAACGNADDDDDGGSAAPEEQSGEGAGEGGEATPASGVPGVTEDEIRFAAFGTNSNNPLGTCNLDCFVDGINAYFAFRNSEGGIGGRDAALPTELADE